ncbi:MAG: VOC family protein, partial [Actinomycetes bacterium]
MGVRGASRRSRDDMSSVSTCLWFDNQAEAAASFYTSLVPRSQITGITRYGESGPGEAGTV